MGVPSHQILRLLAILRSITPPAQFLTIFVAGTQFEVTIPILEVLALLAVEALVAVMTWVRLRDPRPVSQGHLVLQIHLDILMLGCMLYLTGGTTNPFAPLFLLPLAIAAASVDARWVIVSVISTVVVYGLLRVYHVPMEHPAGEQAIYELHESGMLANYALIAALLAYFVMRMRQVRQRHEQMLAEVQRKQLRNDSTAAIGALAAGCAHELSSPLATMAVVVKELQRERADDEPLCKRLRLVGDQLLLAKGIVSNLTAAAGQRRAESAGPMALNAFVASIVERFRALYPSATVVMESRAPGAAPVLAVEETLRQAITNLVDNAVRVSPGHVGVITDWNGSEMTIQIEDRGPGFPVEVLSGIGDTVVSSGSLPEGGGLGLLLAKASIELRGGTLTLTNRPDGGARALIRLPLGPAPPTFRAAPDHVLASPA